MNLLACTDKGYIHDVRGLGLHSLLLWVYGREDVG
jgi:hypothetical protein